jgi:hypothetical protein
VLRKSSVSNSGHTFRPLLEKLHKSASSISCNCRIGMLEQQLVPATHMVAWLYNHLIAMPYAIGHPYGVPAV